jgi:hypothetical protein
MLCVNQLLLQGKDHGAQSKQILLAFEQLSIDLRNSQSKLVGIAQAYGCDPDVIRGLKAGNQGVDEGNIHEGQSNG